MVSGDDEKQMGDTLTGRPKDSTVYLGCDLACVFSHDDNLASEQIRLPGALRVTDSVLKGKFEPSTEPRCPPSVLAVCANLHGNIRLLAES